MSISNNFPNLNNIKEIELLTSKKKIPIASTPLIFVSTPISLKILTYIKASISCKNFDNTQASIGGRYLIPTNSKFLSLEL